jgi:hypothetical protein
MQRQKTKLNTLASKVIVDMVLIRKLDQTQVARIVGKHATNLGIAGNTMVGALRKLMNSS